MALIGPSNIEIVVPVVTGTNARFSRGSIIRYSQGSATYYAVVKAHDHLNGNLIIRPIPNDQSLLLPPIGIRSNAVISSFDGSISIGLRGPFFSSSAGQNSELYAISRPTGFDNSRHELFSSYTNDGKTPATANIKLFSNSIFEYPSTDGWQKLIISGNKIFFNNPGFSVVDAAAVFGMYDNP